MNLCKSKLSFKGAEYMAIDRNETFDVIVVGDLEGKVYISINI